MELNVTFDLKGPYNILIYLTENQSDTIENEETHSIEDKIKLLEQVSHLNYC